MRDMAPVTVGVLALQGGVGEHIALLKKAATHIASSHGTTTSSPKGGIIEFNFVEVRTAEQLARTDALIIPGGESTTMAIVARRLGLLDPLRHFVKVDHKPVWGTCAGLVMLAEEASATKQGGQELVGGLDVRVLRNRYGTQIQSFVAELDLPFLGDGEKPFRGVFIRAPVVEEIMSRSAAGESDHVAEPAANGNSNNTTEPVQVLGVFRKPGATGEPDEDVVAVRQRNVFGTSFHPELTDDIRIHTWWLGQVLAAVRHGDLVVSKTE